MLNKGRVGMGKMSLIALVGAVLFASAGFANPGAARTTTRVLTQAEEVRTLEILLTQSDAVKAQDMIVKELGTKAGVLWTGNVRMGGTLIVGGLKALHGKVNNNPNIKVKAEDLKPFVEKYPNTSAIGAAYELCSAGGEVSAARFDTFLAQAEKAASLPVAREYTLEEMGKLTGRAALDALLFHKVKGSDGAAISEYVGKVFEDNKAYLVQLATQYAPMEPKSVLDADKKDSNVDTGVEFRTKIKEGAENFDSEAESLAMNFGFGVYALQKIGCPTSTTKADGLTPSCRDARTAHEQWRAVRKGGKSVFLPNRLAAYWEGKAVTGLGHSSPNRVQAGLRNITAAELANPDAYFSANTGVIKCQNAEEEVTLVKN